MKIAIVGAGLSGLGTAIALRRYIKLPDDSETLDIKVYDKSDPHDVGSYGWNDHSDIRLKNQGAAISLQANALRVLRDLDPALAERVHACGFPCTNFTWRTAGGVLLGREYMDLLPISRPVLVKCLMEALPEGAVTYKTVSRIDTREGQKPIVQFDDETSDEVDLVIGADGIRSVVRQSLLGDSEEYLPQYLGSCAVGGVLDMPLPKSLLDYPSINFFVGSSGFFGYCGLTREDNSKLLYFSIYDSDLPKRGLELDHKLITTYLRERHNDWQDPIISQCLEKATLDNIYPIFYLPDLPYWGRDGCVLVGDSGHAMTPASGQGGSQAFEDSQTLALLLAGYLQKYEAAEAVSRSVRGLYSVRHARVETIKANGLRLKEPERPWSWPLTMVIYTAMSVMIRTKHIMSYFWNTNGVVDWDAKAEVEEYIAESL